MTDPVAGEQPGGKPSFRTWMGSMWVYTLLRFGLFLALWGLLAVAGLHGLFAAVLAVLLSVPLSFVLLARPRARFAATIEQRINAQRADRERLDDQLSGEDEAER